MQSMHRRQYLTAVGAGASIIAGCSGGGNGGGDEELAEIVDHEFVDPERSSAIYMPVTVENQSDKDLELVEVECDVFTDNERLDDGWANIGDLEAGIHASAKAELYDLRERLDEVTHYTLTLSYFVGNDEFEHGYEYEDFEVEEE